jgi:pyruvate dehydrogenase E2 component (dihydrolipoamide acetyltransferase)
VAAPSTRSAAGLASPAVRALARERGVDLARVPGHGPGGTVTREDVESASEQRKVGIGGDALVGIRRTMAENMARAHAQVVPATLFDEADVEGWRRPGVDVTVRLIRGIVAGCGAAPALNAWFDGTTLRRDIRARIDVGIAIDTEEGLIVPVVRDVASCDPAALRHHLNALIAAARSRSLALGQLRDATITLSNFGMLAGGHAALVVVPPQVGIVGAGRIAPKAVPTGKGAAFRHMLPLSTTGPPRAAMRRDSCGQ